MVQRGYVTEVGDKFVKVRIERQSACGGNCASCLGCPAEAKIIECPYRGKLVKGDRVELVMEDKRFFKNVFWGYGLPTAGVCNIQERGSICFGCGFGACPRSRFGTPCF